jgi:dihydrodipicolinate synthase/N-acetylneuraminate lyase
VVINMAAIATPFGSDGGPDLDAFQAHVRWLGDAGLDGVFVAGTTGEGVLLEQDEVVALVERAVAAGAPRVIAQIGRPSTRATVALAGRALAAGADGVAAYVPWFYPVTQVQLRRHFIALLEAAGGAPAFMYNIPPRTVNDLDPALAGELAQAGFAGMKDSTGDFARHEAYLRAVDGRDFELYTGSEPLLLRSVRAGATGSISALANCAPELFVRLRDAVARGDYDEAGRVQDQITLLKEQTRAEESTVVAIKRRVRERLAARGVDYPASARAPFT